MVAQRKVDPDRNFLRGLSVALVVLAIDQVAKWLVTHSFHLEERGAIELLPIFRLAWVENEGVSLNLLAADRHLMRWILVAFTAAIALGVLIWMWRDRGGRNVTGLALVLGGALGNILDRVRLGFVVDFLDLHFGDLHPFLVFNVADTSISVGVLMMIARASLSRDRKAVA